MKRAYGCWRDDQKRLWLPAPARGIPPKVPVWDLVWPAVGIWLCLLATFRQYRNDSGQSQGDSSAAEERAERPVCGHWQADGRFVRQTDNRGRSGHFCFETR